MQLSEQGQQHRYTIVYSKMHRKKQYVLKVKDFFQV